MKNILAAILIAFLAACNLTKEVDIDLEDYARQPVVECYLEPGKPFRLLLTQSYDFFDPFGFDSSFLSNTLLGGAKVSISYEGRTVTLQERLAIEPDPLRLFNYNSTDIVPATPGIKYTLSIELANGKKITGETLMLPVSAIDSIKVEFGPQTGDSLARVLTYITDDMSKTNYYRRLLNYASLDSIPDQDFLVTDRLSTNAIIAFGTGYELAEGDTVFNTIFHISKEYYDFLESVELAEVANLNPFAQPSVIKSNVRGDADPIGIFTGLAYDRDLTVVKR